MKTQTATAARPKESQIRNIRATNQVHAREVRGHVQRVMRGGTKPISVRAKYSATLGR